MTSTTTSLRLFAVLMGLAFSSPAAASCLIESDVKTNTLKSECAPKDIMDYLNDEVACGYWSGEYPDGNSKIIRERQEYIRKEMAKLKCDALACSRKDMMNKYANDKEMIDAMETALDEYVYITPKWRDQLCKIKKETNHDQPTLRHQKPPRSSRHGQNFSARNFGQLQH